MVGAGALGCGLKWKGAMSLEIGEREETETLASSSTTLPALRVLSLDLDADSSLFVLDHDTDRKQSSLCLLAGYVHPSLPHPSLLLSSFFPQSLSSLPFSHSNSPFPSSPVLLSQILNGTNRRGPKLPLYPLRPFLHRELPPRSQTPTPRRRNRLVLL